MLISIDERGSINLPTALRRELEIEPGSYLELTVEEGGILRLQPVSIFPGIRLSEKGLEKLKKARESGIGGFPKWVIQEMNDARIDTDQKIS